MSEDPAPLIVLILVGFIASGKSTFATALQELVPDKWRRCNQDELGNRRVVEEHTRMWLRQGKNVVIDRTNIDESQRAHWIQIAREFGAQVDVLMFETPLEVCQARLEKREWHPTIQTIEKGLEVQARFVDSYRPPAREEGWDRLGSLPLEQQMEVYDLEGLNTILDGIGKSELNPMRGLSFGARGRGSHDRGRGRGRGYGGNGYRGGGYRGTEQGWRGGGRGAGWGNRGSRGGDTWRRGRIGEGEQGSRGRGL